jgi:hypothetical protein
MTMGIENGFSEHKFGSYPCLAKCWSLVDEMKILQQ